MATTTGTTLQSEITAEPDASVKRAPTSYRNTIEKGGEFEPESDRYHFYLSYACPWATRALIVRKLKGLEDIIPTTVVAPHDGTDGWPFASIDKFPGADLDPLYNSDYVRDLYLKSDPDYSGRFTIPILWDKKSHKIVNNESAEILRIFNTAFNDLLPADKAGVDIYPTNFRTEIDELDKWIYPNINDGVYRAGYATTQEAYEKAVLEVFDGLDKVEKILAGKDYLVASRLTVADIRLWVTIIRFDPVYVGLFKTNIRTIRDGYPAIHSWLRKLYWTNDAFKSSTDFDHIKAYYYWSHPAINPTRIVPVGPIPNIKPLDG